MVSAIAELLVLLGLKVYTLLLCKITEMRRFIEWQVLVETKSESCLHCVLCDCCSPDLRTSTASAEMHRLCSLQELHRATEGPVLQETGAGKSDPHSAAASARP